MFDRKAELRKIQNIESEFFGWQTLLDYFFQAWVWRFRFHIFYKADPLDCMHDHPWWFITFPFVSYVEEYLNGESVERRVVKSWRFHFTRASHTHRYLGKWSGRGTDTITGTVVTVCLTGKFRKMTVFYKGKTPIVWYKYFLKKTRHI